MIQLYENLQEREGGWGKAQRLPLAPQSPLSQLEPHPHTETISQREDRRIHTHTQLKALRSEDSRKGMYLPLLAGGESMGEK